MTVSSPDTVFCVNHPGTPTGLRCNKCDKPICTKCLVKTPVGYRCRDCVRGQQQIFETALWYDYAIAIVVAAPLAALSGFFIGFLGFYSIILAPVAGGLVAEVVRWAVRRRRGRYLAWVAAGGFALGALGLVAISFLMAVFTVAVGGRGFSFGFIWQLIFAVLGASTVYARLRGISIG